jgi:transposase-like protein
MPRPKVTDMLRIDELFNGRHFDREIIILCVRWYLRFKLSFRDLVEMMSERGIELAHTTIMRRVQRYAPDSRSGGTASHAKQSVLGVSMKPT